MNSKIESIFAGVERKPAPRDRIEILGIVEGQMFKVVVYTDAYIDSLAFYSDLKNSAEFLAYQYVEPGIENDLGPWQCGNWDVVREHPNDNETGSTIETLIAYAPQLGDIVDPPSF